MQRIGGHIHPRHQVELLEDHRAPALPGPRLGAPQSRHVPALHQDLAGRRIQQPVHHAKDRRLAGAGPADDADKGRAVDGKADLVHSRLAAEHPCHGPDFQHVPIPRDSG